MSFLKLQEFSRIRAMSTLLTLMCLLGASYVHAAPRPICPQKIEANKVGFCKNGTFYEWECSSCPPGLGHSIECGRIYYNINVKLKMECVTCEKGTYSDTYDSSQCKSCEHCQENEDKSGLCEPITDATRCTCKSGFYRLQGHCQPCSWCCADNTTNELVPECKNLAKKCSFQTAKFCAPTTSLPSTLPITPTYTTNTTSSTIITSSTTKETQTEGIKINQKNNWVLMIVLAITAVLLLVIPSLAVYFCKRGSSSDRDLTQDNSNSKELDSSGPLLPQDNAGKGDMNGIIGNIENGAGQPLLSTDNNGNHGRVVLDPNTASASCEVEHEGSNGIRPLQTNGIILPTRKQNKEQLSFISQKLGEKIVDLEHTTQQTLCKMLNVQVDGKDYRNLDSFSKMDFYDKHNLKKLIREPNG